MAITYPFIETGIAPALAQSELGACECDRGVQYEHRCCGQVGQDGRCCLNPEWVMRECDLCGGGTTVE